MRSIFHFLESFQVPALVGISELKREWRTAIMPEAKTDRPGNLSRYVVNREQRTGYRTPIKGLFFYCTLPVTPPLSCTFHAQSVPVCLPVTVFLLISILVNIRLKNYRFISIITTNCSFFFLKKGCVRQINI